MPQGSRKSRAQFLRAFASHMRVCHITPDETVLIAGGSFEDAESLAQLGLTRVLNSNMATDLDRAYGDKPGGSRDAATIDIEKIDFPDDSFDIVFAHEVLHHCRSPHLALCEMLRVCKKHVLFLEPNDSVAMRCLEALRFSFPYELGAVVGHDFKSGGVRDTHVPNFIYRWNHREVYKTVSSFTPERFSSVHTYAYWDFNATESDIDGRVGSRIGRITSFVGTRNFLRLLRFAQAFLNFLPPTRAQGNKFFCCIEKHAQLKPWLLRKDSEIVYNTEFSSSRID